jgi:gamma-glutamyltranspeptidase/glutathione hydrolase
MTRFRSLTFAAGLILLPCLASAQSVNQPIMGFGERHFPVLGSGGMVAAQERLASEVGAKILEDGGNAVDAAVAVGFSLAVTMPISGNIGGGGFMLIHDADRDEEIAIDYREMAPKRATRDMFLDEQGNVDNNKARFSHLSVGVPGTVAGLHIAHEKYGRLPWKQLLQPAIQQAREGIVLSHFLAQLMQRRQQGLCRFAAACTYFFDANGVPKKPGDLLVQEDLARTLELIADKGPEVFYRGEIAEKIAAEMQRHGGLVDMESLAAYKTVTRDVIRGSYQGFEIVTMPPPSSGGVHLIQMLNVLDHFPLAEMGSGSADKVHVLAETARLAYADRSVHLGDPDFYDVPVKWLTSAAYAKQLAATIDMSRARPSQDVAPGVEPIFESDNTTHYSVIDADGNVVSNTYTLNFSFGSGIAVPGAGFLLNNEMDDFSSKPNSPNGYGLLGGKANAIETDKRPLSSMTPVIVFADGEPWFATGSPGGSRIITTVLQMISNVIDHGMNIAAATAAPRMHHQWFPDLLRIEEGFSPDTHRILEARGHVLSQRSAMGSLQTVGIVDGVFIGASDPRRPGSASVAPSIESHPN